MDRDQSLEDEIVEIATFLNEFDSLVQAHGVRFITRRYENLVDKEWFESLLKLDETELFLLPVKYDSIFDQKKIEIAPSLRMFLRKCRLFSFSSIPANFSNLEIVTQGSVGDEEQKVCLEEDEFHEQITKAMKPKKRHEVGLLANLIYRVALSHGCKSILDLGCGQGYLMQVLAFYYKLDVLGVDSSAAQTKGALKRAMHAQAHLTRYIWKHKHLDASKIDLSPVFLTMICPIDTNIKISNLQKIASSDALMEPKAVEKKYKKPNEPKPFRKPAVHPLLSEQGVILVGLHTCGDLAPSTLKLFHESDVVKAMINVGCCYNLMTDHQTQEEKGNAKESENLFLESEKPYLGDSEENPDKQCGAKLVKHVGGYPLSELATRLMPKLSRAARVLACQSVSKRMKHVEREKEMIKNRMDSSNANTSKIEEEETNEDEESEESEEILLPVDLVHRSQVFRAVLQFIYEEHYESGLNYYSGQYSKEYLRSFAIYCNHIISRQSLPKKLTDEELEQIWEEKGVPIYHKLVAFDNLRVCLSSVIEAFILKDRLLFLRQQDASHGSHNRHELIPIFDASISPRNMAFLSSKIEKK